MPPSSVFITGASTGIGEACALRLDRLGYTVFAGVRKPEDAARLASLASPRLKTIRIDVTRAAEVAAAAAELEAVLGPAGLGALVNNAGVASGGPLEFVPIDLVRQLFEVNVLGMLAVTQACLPMLRRARGRIVNMGSIAGKSVTPYVVPYTMSKHAVEALTDGLRLELAEAGIEVSVIEPGAVRTPIWDKGKTSLAEAERTLPSIALERYGAKLKFFGKVLAHNNERGVSPERVADAVVAALQATPPRTRYLVGRDAKVRALITRFLPDRIGDALLRKAMARLERDLA